MKNLFVVMLMIASMFFFGCSDDEDTKLTKEETKIEITKISADLSVKIAEMTESEGMIAMEALMSLEDPFNTNKSDKKSTVLNNVHQYLLPSNYINLSAEKSTFEPVPFDFDTYVGVYTYHNTPFPYWEIVPGGTSISINFPSDSLNLDVNDAVFTMHDYSEILIDNDYLPTNINIDLYVSEVKLIDINLTAAWNTDGELIGEPKTLNVNAYLMPFDFIGSFNNSNTAANIDFAINDNGEQFFSTGIDVTWLHAGDSIPTNINGYMQFFDVKFQADIDLANMMLALSDITNYFSKDLLVTAINNEIDAHVTVSGNWAADIKLDLLPIVNYFGEDDFDLDILFVYADGTSESAIPYFEDLAYDMEEFFGELGSYFDSWE